MFRVSIIIWMDSLQKIIPHNVIAVNYRPPVELCSGFELPK